MLQLLKATSTIAGLFQLAKMFAIQVMLYCYQVFLLLLEQLDNTAIESTIKFKHGEEK